MTKLNSDEALLDLLNAIREYDYQATLDAIVVLKDAVIEEGVPELDSTWDEVDGRRCYGKFLD